MLALQILANLLTRAYVWLCCNFNRAFDQQKSGGSSLAVRAVCVDDVCGLGPGVRDGADSRARPLVKQTDLIRRV